MPINYESFPLEDLKALKAGKYDSVSLPTLLAIKNAAKAPEQSNNPADYPQGKTASEAERMRQEFYKQEASTGTKIRDTLKPAMPYVRPLLEGTGAVLGGLATLPFAPATAGLAPVAGTATGYATGKYLADLAEGKPQSAGQTLADLGTGATFEMGGQVAAPIIKAGISQVSANPLARKLMDMTLKQGTTLKPDIRRSNVTTALEGGYVPNQKSVDVLARDISAAESEIGQGIAAGEQAGVKGTFQKAIDNIESLRIKAQRSSDPIKANAMIDAEVTRLQGHPAADIAGEVLPTEMQAMKIQQGRDIKYQQKTGQPVDPFQAEIDKARVRGFKEELETQLAGVFPELKAKNGLLGAKYQLQDVLERAASRIDNNQGIGIALPIKTGAGAGIGSVAGPVGSAVGATLGTILGIAEHPVIAPRIARAIYRSAKGSISMADAVKLTQQRLNMPAKVLLPVADTMNQGEQQ